MVNEKRLIDANAFIEDIKTEAMNLCLDGMKGTPRPRSELYDIIDRIGEQPTVDAVEVVYGKWTPVDVIAKKAGYSVRYYHHAECKVNPCRLFECMDDYCPNCGAKMDGGNEDV